MGNKEISAFLTALAVERRVAASTQNQALAAILFLYKEVLGAELGWCEDIVRAKRPARLPVVLTRAEVDALFAELYGVSWLIAMFLYGSGLRFMEALRLRVKDVDRIRHEVLVRDGKGGRDRITMLPSSIDQPLAAHLARARRMHEQDLAAGNGRVVRRRRWVSNVPMPTGSGDGSGSFHPRPSRPIPVRVKSTAIT